MTSCDPDTAIHYLGEIVNKISVLRRHFSSSKPAFHSGEQEDMEVALRRQHQIEFFVVLVRFRLAGFLITLTATTPIF